jgi:hypothetical protein
MMNLRKFRDIFSRISAGFTVFSFFPFGFGPVFHVGYADKNRG